MEKISNFLDRDSLLQTISAQAKPQSDLSEHAKKMVEELFKIFTTHVVFFRYAHAENQKEFLNTKREWVKTFQERQTTEEEVKMGIIKLRRMPESIKNITPAEFLNLCKVNPSDIGLPDTETAYSEAIRNHGVDRHDPKWSHKVIQHAAYHSGSYELMNLSRIKSFSIFERNYKISIRMFLEDSFKEINKALTHDDGLEYRKQQDIVDKYPQFKNVRGAEAMKNALKGIF